MIRYRDARNIFWKRFRELVAEERAKESQFEDGELQELARQIERSERGIDSNLRLLDEWGSPTLFEKAWYWFLSRPTKQRQLLLEVERQQEAIANLKHRHDQRSESLVSQRARMAAEDRLSEDANRISQLYGSLTRQGVDVDRYLALWDLNWDGLS